MYWCGSLAEGNGDKIQGRLFGGFDGGAYFNSRCWSTLGYGGKLVIAAAELWEKDFLEKFIVAAQEGEVVAYRNFVALEASKTWCWRAGVSECGGEMVYWPVWVGELRFPSAKVVGRR